MFNYIKRRKNSKDYAMNPINRHQTFPTTFCQPSSANIRNQPKAKPNSEQTRTSMHVYILKMCRNSFKFVASFPKSFPISGPVEGSKYWGATLYFGQFLSFSKFFFSESLPPCPTSSAGPESVAVTVGNLRAL